ncbi:MAG TPA: hypothetical protein DEB46_10050 [Myxococcales bacterium]|nr:hypothetical protein [Myxococcales bacterium]
MVSFRQLSCLFLVGLMPFFLACYEVETTTCVEDKDCVSPLYCDATDGVCLRATPDELTDDAMAKRVGCGNGRLDGDEACDDGNEVPDDSCSDCALARCGDEITRTDLVPGAEGYEACDDGDTDNEDHCLNNCQVAECGDGVLRTDLNDGEEGYEACDDGNDNDADACRNNCRPSGCGDGILDEGEACDDGNLVATDSCTDACQVADCGDGVVRTDLNEQDDDFEACDDGNDDVADACVNCTAARCGDGHHRTDLAEGNAGYEACDDGNDVDHDGCSTDCQLPTCGDGIVRTDLEPEAEGYEECDDGGGIYSVCRDCRWAPQQFAALSLGLNFTCAIDREENTVKCWGQNEVAQVQDGYRWGQQDPPPLDRSAPRTVSSQALQGAIRLRAGEAGVCAEVESEMYCWGFNVDSMLGVPPDVEGRYYPVFEPSVIPPPTSHPRGDGYEIHEMAVGHSHTCVILGAGRRLYCWGRDSDECCDYNKTGTRHLDDDIGRHLPLPVQAFAAADGGQHIPIKTVVTGVGYTAAIDGEGEVVRWGNLPNTEPTGRHTIAGFPGIDAGALKTLSAGAEHVCGLTATGDAWCSGSASSGRLGRSGRVSAGRHPFVQVEAYQAGTCALNTQGEVYCWGSNAGGQLGQDPFAVGGLQESQIKMKIELGEGVRAIALGKGGFANHRCVMVQDASGEAVRCWGSNAGFAVGHPVKDSYIHEPFDPDLFGRRQGTAETPAHSCLALRDGHDHETGGAWLQPPGADAPGYVWCDQDTDRGGWGLIMHIPAGHEEAGYDGALWQGTSPIQDQAGAWTLTNETGLVRTVLYTTAHLREMRLEMRTGAVILEGNNGGEFEQRSGAEADPDQLWRTLSLSGDIFFNGGTLAGVIAAEPQSFGRLDGGLEAFTALLPMVPDNELNLNSWMQPTSFNATRRNGRDDVCALQGANVVHRPDEIQGGQNHHRTRLGVIAVWAGSEGPVCPWSHHASVIGFGAGGHSSPAVVGGLTNWNNGGRISLSASGRIWVR